MKTTETTTQHTPGPWLAGQTITAADPGRAPGSYERITIASRVNNMTNARLIAAAPELLAACIHALAKLECAAEKAEPGSQMAHWFAGEDYGLKSTIRAAIAKATGGAQ